MKYGRFVEVITRLGATIFCLAIPIPALACTIFFAEKDGLALAGNNEDFYLDVTPKIWVSPSDGDAHGRITFGFSESGRAKPFAQGGVNDRGLFFDAAVTPELGEAQKKKTKPPRDMGDAMLAACANVDEAVAWLKDHDLRLLKGSHFLLADKSGNAVVVELIGEETTVIPSGKRYIAATNFSFTKPEAGNFPCPRFNAVRHTLGDETPDPDVSITGFRDLLAKTAVPRTQVPKEDRFGGTVYSNVYDLTNGTITLYRESRFDAPLTIDVGEWLAKGEAAYEMDEVFGAE